MIDREAAMPATASAKAPSPRWPTGRRKRLDDAEPPDRRRSADGRGRHPRGARRGAGRRGDRLRRRAAGRPGGPAGPAVRRPGRAGVRPGAGRGRHRPRSGVYVTNAVKHFKYVQRGKRRLHQRPTAGEVKHYRWWLKTELDLVGPRVVVALGATAVLALAGKALPISANRGETRFDNRRGYITVHPSYLLRLPDEAEKAAGLRGLPRRPRPHPRDRRAA